MRKIVKQTQPVGPITTDDIKDITMKYVVRLPKDGNISKICLLKCSGIGTVYDDLTYFFCPIFDTSNMGYSLIGKNDNHFKEKRINKSWKNLINTWLEKDYFDIFMFEDHAEFLAFIKSKL